MRRRKGVSIESGGGALGVVASGAGAYASDEKSMRNMRIYAVCLGMASLWMCLQASGFYPLSLVANVGSADAYRIACYHLTYTVSLVVFVVISMFFQSMTYRIVEHAAFLAMIGVFGVAGQVLIATSSLQNVPSLPIFAGCVLTAAFVVGMVFFWGTRLAGNDFNQTMLYLAVSYSVSQMVSACYFSLSLPQAPLLVSCSALCALCAFIAGPGNIVNDEEPPYASVRRLPWSMLVPLLFLVYFCEIFIRLRIGAFSGDVEPARKMITSLVAGGTFALVAIVLYVSREHGSERSLMVVFAILVVAYLLALLIVLLFDASNQYVTNRVLIACAHCVEVLFWMVVLNAVTKERISPVMAFGFLAIVAIAVPWGISFDAYYLLHLDAYFSQRDILAGGVAIAILVAAASSIAFLLRYAFDSAEKGEAVKGREAWNADGAPPLIDRPSVHEALMPFGLTKREFEVAEYLYRGYSAKKIADMLFLSEASIRAHTMHIYRKMDIHSKQDFISYIDDASENPPA